MSETPENQIFRVFWNEYETLDYYISAGGESGNAKEQMTDEKNQRGQLLALNQVLARQVMEKSRMVAGRLL